MDITDDDDLSGCSHHHNQHHDQHHNHHLNHHVHWNSLLPYQVAEGSLLFDEIIGEMGASLESLDFIRLDCVSGKLEQLLDLKLHLRDEQWERLVYLCYELVVSTPCAHAPTMQSFALLLLRIFRLPVIKHLKIELAWRPMYELVLEYLYQPSRQAKLYSDENCVKAVLRLAERSRKFFPSPCSGEDLLEEIKEYLCPIQTRKISQYTSMLVTFCPNETVKQLVPLLKPTEGILWNTASRRLESLNMLLISRLVKTDCQIDWTDWSPFLFNILRRHLKLPGPESGPKSINKWNPEEKPGNRLVRSIHGDYIRYFSKWLVRSISNTNGLLDELESLLQALDSFFHPSNGGSWSGELGNLLSTLVYTMNKRINRKGLAYSLPPLSQETVDRFSAIIWPAVDKLVFSKNFFTSLNAQETIKGLSNISPQPILTQVISMAEPSLVTLTEPHRTNASIGVLGAVARKMLDQGQFPGGIATMIGLMHAVLPGIDANDPLKTMSTLSFISNTLTVMPLFDISVSFESGEDSLENAMAESTASLESFVLLFLQQCFHYISNMTKPTEGQEAGGSALLINTLDLFFQQLSPSLLSLGLEKIRIFLRDESPIHGAEVLGHLVGKAAMRSSEYPKVLEGVLMELQNQFSRGTGQEENQPDESCSRLICHLNVLLRLLHYMLVPLPASLLDRLMSIFQTGSKYKQKTVVELLAKSFKAMIKAMSGVYPRDWTSYQAQHPVLVDFGRLYRLDEIEINWREPTSDDLCMSLNLCRQFMLLLDGVEFMRSRLIMLRSLLKAVLSLRANTKLYSVDSSNDADDLFSNLVERIIAFNPLLTTVECKGIMIDIIGLALTYRGISRSTYSNVSRSLGYLKSALSYYKKDPLRPRFWYVKRAHQQHLCRMEKESWSDVQEIPQWERLYEILLAYSMDHCPELYPEAQSELGAAVVASPALIRRLIADWSRHLSGQTDEDVLKALLSVKESALTSAICSDWSLLRQFLAWLVPLNDRPGIEKIPKIYDLITSVFIDSARSFTAPPFLSQPDSKLGAMLGITVDATRHNERRAEERNETIKFLLDGYHSMTWRAKIMTTTYLLIIINDTDRIPDELVCVFVEGCSSDVYDVRFSSLQAAKLALHAWNQQQEQQESLGHAKNKDLIPSELLAKVLQMSLVEETDDAGKLEFRAETSRLIQSLTDIVGPAMLVQVTNAIQSTDEGGATWSAGKQRAAAEWIAGLLKSLHFTIKDAQEMEVALSTTLKPLIKLAWSRCGVDSSRYWFAALLFATRSRQPEIVMPLYNFVKEELTAAVNNPSSSSTDLVIAVLSMQAILKGATELKGDELVPLVLGGLFTSQYLVVRREAAQLLREILRNSNSNGKTVTLIVSPLPTETLKALIEFTHSSFFDPVLTGIWQHLPALLQLFLRSHQSNEIELQLATKLVCRRAAWLDYCPSKEMLTEAMEAVLQVASDPAAVVQVRRLAIETAGALYGRNYSLFDERMSKEYLGRILSLLDDVLLEVREATASILTALLHTRRRLADDLASATLPSLRSLIPSIKSPDSIPNRHSLTLRSSSLILSTPYQMVPWAPPILLALTRFLPDRAPISGTVRRCFGEFKRTHMDNWATERLLFSEEELDAISELLVSPSYYA